MINSFLNDDLAINRLVKEYESYNNLFIGFDFDNTIFDTNNKDLDVTPVVDLLREASDFGLTMCIHTLSFKKHHVASKLKICKDLGINVHYINESPILKKSYPEENKKAYYSILLDDRAGLKSAYNILQKTLNILQNGNNYNKN